MKYTLARLNFMTRILFPFKVSFVSSLKCANFFTKTESKMHISVKNGGICSECEHGVNTLAKSEH